MVDYTYDVHLYINYAVHFFAITMLQKRFHTSADEKPPYELVGSSIGRPGTTMFLFAVSVRACLP